MDLFNGLINLINEHASSTVLKERIAFLKDRFSTIQEDNLALKSEIQTCQFNLKQAEQIIKELEEQLYQLQQSNPDGYVCDHCGSPSLTRTGSRPDPTFGDLGIKQKLFSCDECGKESAFTPRDKEI